MRQGGAQALSQCPMLVRFMPLPWRHGHLLTIIILKQSQKKRCSIHNPRSIIHDLQSARMRAHPFPEFNGFLSGSPRGRRCATVALQLFLKKRERHKVGTSGLAGPKFPVSDTSHEPNSYRAFTQPHGGQVGGPRPSRPTFIHNSGGLRLLFPLREKSLVFRHGSVQCDTVAFLWQCNQRRSQAERSGTGGAAGDGQRQSAATIPLFSSMNLPHPHFRNTYEPQNS